METEKSGLESAAADQLFKIARTFICTELVFDIAHGPELHVEIPHEESVPSAFFSQVFKGKELLGWIRFEHAVSRHTKGIYVAVALRAAHEGPPPESEIFSILSDVATVRPPEGAQAHTSRDR